MICDTLAAIPLLVLAFLFFRPLLGGSFLTDDFHNIRFATYGPEGKTTFDPDEPTEVLAYFHTKATDRFELYRPLVPLSFRLSYELSKTEARTFILTNILLHLLGALLAMYLARSFFPSLSRLELLFAGALFLFSPLQTQVAFWSSARSDSLCWIFGALALLGKWSNRRSWLWPTFFASLAMLSKESGLVFLCLVGFCDLLPATIEKPTNGKARALRIGLLFVVLLSYIGMRAHIFGDLVGGNSYGSKSFADTLREHGWDNLKTGFLTALAPATSVVIPNESWRLVLKVLLSASTTLVLFFGLGAIAKKGFGRSFLVLALLALPFLMASVVSRLDERFINTRGCYIPMFALATLLALVLQRYRRIGLAIGITLVLASLPTSWKLQELYVESSRGTEQILEAMRRPLNQLPKSSSQQVTILNYQHLTWFQGGFSAAGCLQPALMRPFTPVDYHSTLVLLDDYDPQRAFLTPFEDAIIANGTGIFLDMRLQKEKTAFDFNLLHPRITQGKLAESITAISPESRSEQQLDPGKPNTLIPRFVISHPGILAPNYRVCLFNPKGRVVDTIAGIESSRTRKDGSLEVTLVLPSLSPQMAHNYDQPKHMAWSVYSEGADGEIKAQSALTVYLVGVASHD